MFKLQELIFVFVSIFSHLDIKILQHDLSSIYTSIHLHTYICISTSNYGCCDLEFTLTLSFPIYYRIHLGLSFFHVCNSFFDMRNQAPNMLFTYLTNLDDFVDVLPPTVC